MRTEKSALFVVLSLLIVSGCAHEKPGALGLRKKIEPRALLIEACAPGDAIHRVTGSAAMKAKSKEASGTFSAAIEASAPDHLKLEVLHPFGGTMALLTIEGSEYSVDVPGHPDRNRHGYDSWGGIPLVWATRLFLGKIPCPDSDELAHASMFINSEDELHVEIPQSARTSRQSFVYRFKAEKLKLGGVSHEVYWPEGLHWESGSRNVDFSFDDPDDDTGSPKKWEAQSPQGSVKLHWRNRDLVR